MKCFLFARDEVVGWMEPTIFDDGMNVVSGYFQPNDKYAEIQPLIRAYHVFDGTLGEHNPVELARAREQIYALELRAETEDGEQLEPDGGVSLTDFSEELERDAMQLDIVGLPHEQFLRFWRDVYPDTSFEA